MAEGDIHTSKQGDRWVNKAEGNQRASNSAPTKAEAQATGRRWPSTAESSTSS